MNKPIIIKTEKLKMVEWPGGGKGWVLTAPSLCGAKSLYVGIEYVEPGKSPHRWHDHIYDRGDDFEVIYPEDFEESYIIVKGSGTLFYEWDGEKKNIKVKEGDAIYFPPNIGKHELINTGEDIMILVFAGTPTPTIRKI